MKNRKRKKLNVNRILVLICDAIILSMIIIISYNQGKINTLKKYNQSLKDEYVVLSEVLDGIKARQ